MKQQPNSQSTPTIMDCQLCAKDRKLENSHIIPKFIFDWIKRTGTGGLRMTENLNVRVQDGIKVPFLCAECEDLFGGSERYFSKHIFYPIVNEDSNSFEYNEKLFYFAISVLWRTLKHSLLAVEKDQPHYLKLLAAEQQWQNYLLKGQQISDFNQLHLLIGVDFTEGNEGLDLPDRFIQYMGRGVDAGIAENETECMIFLKLPRFIFIVPICGFDSNKMINTEINKSGGSYLVNVARIENPTIGKFFIEKIRSLDKIFEEISPAQREKMRAKYVEKWDELKGKDLRRILEYERKVL